MSQTLNPTTVLSVALEAQQWNTVLQLLNDVMAPHRVTSPIIQAMMGQLMPRQQQLDDDVVQMPRKGA